jgi:hypothetical protein
LNIFGSEIYKGKILKNEGPLSLEGRQTQP